MCRFSVDGCGFVGVYQDVHVRKRSIMSQSQIRNLGHDRT